MIPIDSEKSFDKSSAAMPNKNYIKIKIELSYLNILKVFQIQLNHIMKMSFLSELICKFNDSTCRISFCNDWIIGF